jgi:hypothetical protein
LTVDADEGDAASLGGSVRPSKVGIVPRDDSAIRKYHVMESPGTQ